MKGKITRVPNELEEDRGRVTRRTEVRNRTRPGPSTDIQPPNTASNSARSRRTETGTELLVASSPEADLGHKAAMLPSVGEEINERLAKANGRHEVRRALEREGLKKQLELSIRSRQTSGQLRLSEETFRREAAFEQMISMDPRDAAERMLATQMVTAHTTAMDYLDLAEGAPLLRDRYRSEAAKFMNIYTQLLASWSKYKGKNQQKIVVERVNVNEGARAIIGNVGGGGQTFLSPDRRER